MYAIFAADGRQYKVEEGQELTIDFRDAPAGDKITFDKVLAVSDGSGDFKLGAPTLEGASVQADVLGAEKAKDPPPQKFSPQNGSSLGLYEDQDCEDLGVSGVLFYYNTAARRARVAAVVTTSHTIRFWNSGA